MPLFRPLAAAALMATLASPITARSEPKLGPPGGLDDMLREMMEDFGPTIEDLIGLMRAFEDIDDPRHYQMPEILPNGDIIIRRRPDAPEFRPDPPADDAPEEDGAVKT